jgi:Voltage gated chloride channel
MRRRSRDPDALAYLRLVGLGALIGIPTALLAAVFLAFIHDLEHWLWDDLPSGLGASSPPWYLVIGLPAAGGFVVLFARRFLPGDGGHPPLEGIGGGHVPIANGPGIALAAVGTLAFGAVLGPEAPLIALGAVVGSAVTLFARLDEKSRSVLATAGSFSAISALFGGPVVGGMMMVEGGLEMGTMLLAVLLPGFVAAAIGYVLFVGLERALLAVARRPEPAGLQRNARPRPGRRRRGRSGRRGDRRGRPPERNESRSRGPRRLGLPVLLVGGGLAVGLTAQTAIGWAPTPRTSCSPVRRASPTRQRRPRRSSSSCWSARRSATRSASGAASAAAPSFRRSSSGSPSRNSPAPGSTSHRRSQSPPGQPPGWPPGHDC